MIYLHSSALPKLVVADKQSLPRLRFLKRELAEWASCALARTEVLRATRSHGAAALERARASLQTVQLVQLGDARLGAAGMLDPLQMRSRDAIHLAAASLVAPELTAWLTYDKRMAEGAARPGFPVVSPA